MMTHTGNVYNNVNVDEKLNETILLLRKPVSKPTPSIQEVNQRIGMLRQERAVRKKHSNKGFRF